MLAVSGIDAGARQAPPVRSEDSRLSWWEDSLADNAIGKSAASSMARWIRDFMFSVWLVGKYFPAVDRSG